MFSSVPTWLKTAAPWLGAGIAAAAIAGYFVAPKIAALYEQRPPYEEQCLDLKGKIAFNPNPTVNPNGLGTVTITGSGPSGYSATLVTVRSVTPGVTVVSAGQQAFPGGVINGTWTLSGLTPGQWITLNVDAVDPGHGSKPGTDKCCSATITLEVPGKIDLGVQKTTSLTPSDPKSGGGYEFTLQATNLGAEIDIANIATVSDVVPANLQITGASGTNWNCGPLSQYPLAAGSTLTCVYTGPVPIITGAVLPPITVKASVVGDPKDTIINCATVAPQTGSGYIDTNAANNESCSAIYTQFSPHDPPPPFHPECGMDVLFVVDESYSIFDPSNTGSGPNETTTVANALIAAAHAFAGNGAQAEVIYFGSSAGMSTDSWGNWQTLTAANANSIANTYSPATSPFGTNTNWEAALLLAKNEVIAHGTSRPTVVVFITDGKPNYYLDDNTGAITAAPVDGSGNTTPAGEVLSTNQAIPDVDAIYANGNKIIGIGVGPFMTSPVPPNPDPNGSVHLGALLGGGTPVTAGSSPFDPANSSVIVSNDYSALTNILLGMAGAVCPKIQLNKIGSSISFAQSDFDESGTLTNTAKLTTHITLKVRNLSAAPMSGIQLKDVLPGLPKRLNIGTPPNYSQPGGSSTNSGGRDTVIWNVPANLNLTPFGTPGDSQQLTFDVKVEKSWVEARYAATPPDGNPHSDHTENFAQVTAVDQTVGSLMGNMGDDGPVTEIDESEAPVTIYTQKVCGPPTDCTHTNGTPSAYLNVKKTYNGGGETPCLVGQPCTFSITVQGNYLGPVAFGDGVFNTTPGNHTTLNSGSTPTGVTTAESTTSTQTQPMCSSPTSAPWSCYAATFPGAPYVATSAPNITNDYTFTYTFSFIPTAPGSEYTNCFFAMPWTGAAPTGFSQVYNKWFTSGHAAVPYYVNQNGPYAGDGGDCADVHTAGQPPQSHVTPPGTEKKKPVDCDTHNSGPAQQGTCPCSQPGMKRNRAGVCGCPNDTKFVKGKGCTTPKPPPCDTRSTSPHGNACLCRYPSMTRISKTACGCPPGARYIPGVGCVSPHDQRTTPHEQTPVPVPQEKTVPPGPACQAPMTPNAHGVCQCPDGMKLKKGQCVKKGSFFDNFHVGVGVGGGGGGGGKPDGAGPHP